MLTGWSPTLQELGDEDVDRHGPLIGHPIVVDSLFSV
jgi:hypothetical protein